jgi:hypothetical protein
MMVIQMKTIVAVVVAVVDKHRIPIALITTIDAISTTTGTCGIH